MKTNYAIRDVASNATQSKVFTIKQSNKAFKILIDGLYRDKIQSVTREIWTNAYDSHRMAGKEHIPFEVHFPTVFEPSFKVKDYGVGLSHDQVMNMYTTLFESTKEDTNEQVGKLGIGSKTPFAYTDIFSLVAIYNGEKNYYSAAIDENGMPTIHLLHSEVVDEENGVEVSFPVAKGDVPLFQRAAKMVSFGFDVKPIVTGVKDFVWPNDDEIQNYFGSSYVAKMGCVIYPIDYSMLRQYGEEIGEYHSEMIDFYASYNGLIDFPIGSLEPTASREALSYGKNEPTLNSIFQYFEDKFKDIKENTLKFINDFKDKEILANVIYTVESNYDRYSYSHKNTMIYNKVISDLKRYNVDFYDDIKNMKKFYKILKIMKLDSSCAKIIEDAKKHKKVVKIQNEYEDIKLANGVNTKRAKCVHSVVVNGHKKIRSLKNVEPFNTIEIENDRINIVIFDDVANQTKKLFLRIARIDDEGVDILPISNIRDNGGFTNQNFINYILIQGDINSITKMKNTIDEAKSSLFYTLWSHQLAEPPKRVYSQADRADFVNIVLEECHPSSSGHIYSKNIDDLDDDEFVYYVPTHSKKIVDAEITENIVTLFAKAKKTDVLYLGTSKIRKFERYYGDKLIVLTKKHILDTLYEQIMDEGSTDSNKFVDILSQPRIEKEISKYFYLSNLSNIDNARITIPELKNNDFYVQASKIYEMNERKLASSSNDVDILVLLKDNDYDISTITKLVEYRVEKCKEKLVSFYNTYKPVFILTEISTSYLYSEDLKRVKNYAMEFAINEVNDES